MLNETRSVCHGRSFLGLAGPLNEEQHKQMNMVQNSSRHLLSLINAMVGDRERILAAGATGYIEKPINPETFVGEIRKYL